MQKYTLHYFNARGKAELSRLILHQAEVEFEDKRYTHAEWKLAKENDELFPLGKMPVLQIDGNHSLPQSLSIARFLANEYGLSGKDNLEKAACDSVVYCIQDLLDHYYTWVHLVSEEEAKAQNEKNFYSEVLPKALKDLEKLHLRNDKGRGFFVGEQVTMADLYLIVLDDMWSEEYLETVESLKKLLKRVRALPNIKKYLENRPQTKF